MAKYTKVDLKMPVKVCFGDYVVESTLYQVDTDLLTGHTTIQLDNGIEVRYSVNHLLNLTLKDAIDEWTQNRKQARIQELQDERERAIAAFHTELERLDALLTDWEENDECQCRCT